jgi:cystathionine beta-lyase
LRKEPHNIRAAVNKHRSGNRILSDHSKQKTAGINTRLAHCGNDPHDFHGFINPPVARGSTVLFPDAETMATGNQRYTYGTASTPTHDALRNAIDELEGSAGTIVVPSGLAAVTIPFLGFVSSGDHVLITDAVYYPTRRFADKMLAVLGVEVEYYDPGIGAEISRLIRDNTSVIFTESPGSNTFEIQDIPAICQAAHAADAIVMMDNTWATPLFFRPLDHGVDISIHAATKYPSGHADILLGLVSSTEKCWPKLYQTYLTVGACSGADDAYQILRGLRTMGIRLERHQKSALEIARWLESHPGVAQVLHPALESHPGNEIWKRDFCGSSGLFSIVLDGGGKKQGQAFVNAFKLFGIGSSWGAFESLAVHVFLGDRKITKGNYPGPVVRLQIGLEDVEDLKADLERGLAAAASV